MQDLTRVVGMRPFALALRVLALAAMRTFALARSRAPGLAGFKVVGLAGVKTFALAGSRIRRRFVPLSMTHPP